MTGCDRCGAPLLLIVEGRARCEKCRIENLPDPRVWPTQQQCRRCDNSVIPPVTICGPCLTHILGIRATEQAARKAGKKRKKQK